MAVAEIRPDWTIGTLNLTAGVDEFTTTGSLLQTAAIQPGDELITSSGLVLIIATITGQNSGTLMEPCPSGAAGADQPLRVRFQPDGSRYNGATADLVQLLGSGNVYAFSELDGTSGGVPVFTGAGTMDVVPSGEVGIQDTNGSLANLAAVTLAARQILQTDETGALVAIELAANKALVTDANSDVQQIELGTLGRALLALTTGTTAQFVQADGTLQEKALLPVSTPVQTALNAKANLNGAAFTGAISTTGNLSTNGIFSMRAANETADASLIRWNNYTGALAWALTLQSAAFEGLAFSAFNNGAWLRNPLTIAKSGNVAISGAISKGSGTFLIDHPTDPFNKNLRHGFVESTEYVNIYRGIVDLIDGRMIVDIDAAFGMTDGTFEALNAEVMVSSLQNQYGPDRVWVEAAPDSGKFTIICENNQSTATIAWMVTGRRNDAFVRSALDPNTDSEGRFIPEFDKEDA